MSILGKVVGGVGFVGLAIGGLIYWGSRPSEGEREFQLSQQELRKATSWRYKHQWSDRGEAASEIVEVSCPSSQHIVRHTPSPYGHLYPAVTAEYIQIGRDQYIKPAPDQPWMRPAEPIPDITPVCDRVARGEDTTPFPSYNLWRRQGLYQKGALESLDGGIACQDWTAKVPVQNPRPDDISKFCLGTLDHLPYQHTWSTGEFQFYDWNVPFTIEPPALVSSQPQPPPPPRF